MLKTMKEALLQFPAIQAIKRSNRGAGQALLLLFSTFGQLPWLWFRRKELLTQMYLTGISSFFVVNVVAAFSGMIICLQTGLALRDFGQQEMIGQVIIVTLAREFSPFMTSIILAAAVGSAMAAELGTMSVSEEIDALNVMSIDPVRYLILPRIIGFAVTVPILSAYSVLIGTLGGSVIAKTQLGVDFHKFFLLANEILRSPVGLKDIWVGSLKALIFGFCIATIASYQGLIARNGAIGVGLAVRKAVVHSFLFVLVLGYYISNLFYR